MKNVFISYSHKDKDWVKEWLVPRLENNDLETHIDYRDFEVGVPSIINMERAVEQCAKTMLVLTANWLKSDFTQFEGIMLQTEDPIGLKKRILPLMLEDCELPRRLKLFTYADFRDSNEWNFQIERLIRQIKRDFAELEPPKPTFPPLSEENLYIYRLPYTGYELFGRQKELSLLNEAWESNETNVVSFVAFGGVGKTTLINKWNEKMRWDNYRGAQKVFAWSFYSQGTSERVTSADLFIDNALQWFGDSNPEKGSPWDKGKRLAKLICQHKTLLLLDGLEPLQSTFEFEEGKIKDAALSTLLTNLAKNNKGLCVITTREKVYEIDRYPDTCQQVSLEKISDESGAALLRLRRVQGDNEKLEEATRNFGNHALAINLLGTYLQDIHGHHVSHADSIGDLDIPEEQGKHPRRIMTAFAKRFGDGPEVQLLQVLGLFNRPAEMTAVECVKAPPLIPGLTEHLGDLDDGAFLKTCEQLRHNKLLAPQGPHRLDTLDCHPLVREHFSEQLEKKFPEAGKQGHKRLYEYLKSSTEFLPDSVEEMIPLYQAVYHGCKAGLHRKAMDEVISERILRGPQNYSWRILGAHGADLSALSCFFDRPWTKPVDGLPDDFKELLSSRAGFYLRALGRLADAVELMQAGLEAYISRKQLRSAAVAAHNLGEIYLVTGDFDQAIKYAYQSVEFAKLSGDNGARLISWTILTDALHQVGCIDDAKATYSKAREAEKEINLGQSLFYSIQGFRCSDLLLGEGRYQKVLDQVVEGPELASQGRASALGVALGYLAIGQAELIRAQKEKTGEFTRAEANLDKAVDGLRKAAMIIEIPRGLLVRSQLWRVIGEYDKARVDLDEAMDIATSIHMKRFEADCHLEFTRLFLAEGYTNKAKECFDVAKEMISEIGYCRRHRELEELKKQL